MSVTKASIILEVDGIMCAALLDGIDYNLLVSYLASLAGGTLKVIKLNDSFKWESIKDAVAI
jgi:hypothetical protein